jgi:hypothetical protein
MGIANPASNNAAIDQPSNKAAIDQAPDKAAASITGIRCMFRLAGGTIGILVRRARAVPPVKPARPLPASPSARARPTAGAPDGCRLRRRRDRRHARPRLLLEMDKGRGVWDFLLAGTP